MERLEAMIRPDIGIFTNLGDAHQEHFTSLEQKLSEKLILFRHARTILYNAGDKWVADQIARTYADRKLCAVDPNHYDLHTLPYRDQASLENAAKAIALYDILGYNLKSILATLPSLQSVAMRMELKEGINGCKLINDSYNSDINSLAVSLDYLASVAGGQPKVLILSDIRQSGLPAEKLYGQVAALLHTKGIDTLIGIGEEISRHAGLFDCDKHFFRNTEAFLHGYNRVFFVNKSILLKGSRAFGFEKISHALEQRTHTTVLEVNLDANDGITAKNNVSAIPYIVELKNIYIPKRDAQQGGNSRPVPSLSYREPAVADLCLLRGKENVMTVRCVIPQLGFIKQFPLDVINNHRPYT